MHILLLCGSNHPAGRAHTRVLLEFLKSLLQQRGHTTTLWSLRDQPLPIAQAEFYDLTPHPIPIVEEFRVTAAAADAVVLGSPNYHGTYSGSLKNALEHLPYNAFACRPVGLLSHGYGARGCNAPCEQLRIVVKAIHGYALCTQVASCAEDYEDENGVLRLKNTMQHKQCDALIDEMECLVAVRSQLMKENHDV